MMDTLEHSNTEHEIRPTEEDIRLPRKNKGIN